MSSPNWASNCIIFSSTDTREVLAEPLAWGEDTMDPCPEMIQEASFESVSGWFLLPLLFCLRFLMSRPRMQLHEQKWVHIRRQWSVGRPSWAWGPSSEDEGGAGPW